MKNLFIFMAIGVVLLTLVASGCSKPKASSSSEAIQSSKSMETVEQKVDYLVGQAKSFYNSKEFQQTVDIAQYILSYLDKESQEAKDLLIKAKEALVAKAKEAVDTATQEAQKKIGNLFQ